MHKDQQLPVVSVAEGQTVKKEIFPGFGSDIFIWIIVLFFLFGGTSIFGGTGIFGLGTKE